MKEAELVSQLKQGKKSAWKLFYGSYRPLVLKTVSWQGWSFSRSEVEDIVQEIFLAFYQGIKSFKEKSSLSTYLGKLARNICISRLRKKTARKRRPEIMLREPEKQVDPVDENPLPEEQHILKFRIQQLYQGIAGLSLKCRNLISLRYFEDLSYQEISKKLSLPLGTVCSQLSRCLLKLKQILEQNPEFFD